MLPDPNDGPTSCTEAVVRVHVPGNVAFDLRSPELGVPPGWAVVLGAAMPETSIDKHRYLRPRKHQVSGAAHVGEWADADPVSQA
jgi:hypothetical protein